jgi:hypothetical protein
MFKAKKKSKIYVQRDEPSVTLGMKYLCQIGHKDLLGDLIVNRQNLGRNCSVGKGATVTSDVSDDGVAATMPARTIDGRI